MSPSLGWIASSLLLVFLESVSGEVLPPTNLSLRWINDFKPELSWEPPPHPMTNCSYSLLYRGEPDYTMESKVSTEPKEEIDLIMEGRFLQWSVRTSCDSGESEEAVMKVTYPELVKDLQCYGYTANITKCSWLPAADAPDVRFFWTDAPDSPPEHECVSDIQGLRRGCDVEISTKNEFNILINGTLNNTVVKNTFMRYPLSDVRPPPLSWTVTKSEEQFKISWIPPSILTLSLWNFIITVTECGEVKNIVVEKQTSYLFDVKHQCAYCMTIKAESDIDVGSSPVSEEKCFDADVDNNSLLYAAITMPLFMACVTTLTFICCRKNKDKICMKVPEPRDLITETLDNNNKISFNNLYVPLEKEQSCKITLLIDKQAGIPYC